MKYKSVFDYDLKGKTVFVRLDLNSSVVEGRVVISSRLREHSKTIYALSEEGAKVVVLSHQGRAGEDGFISLKRHADHIRKFIDKQVQFVAWEKDYVSAIKEMKDGEVVVLDNTRFQKEEEEKKTPEEHANDSFIKKLGPLGDLFVQDALSVCHRGHASVVGFKKYMPCVVGPTLQRELDALGNLENTENGERVVVLGGAKLKDSVKLLKGILDSGMCNKACIGGLFGELLLKANGTDFGNKEKFFEEQGFSELLGDAKEIIEKNKEKIILPIDLAAEQGGKRVEIPIKDLPSDLSPMDIGKDTTEEFKTIIRTAKVVVFNGPMGVYEKKSFAIGTKKVLEAIAFHRCYSIIGGGDTERALTSFGLVPADFSHVSLAGKALLQFLSGKPLPGLEVLEKA
ncbi:MAG: phosphoglycerate kinase [Candidatus Diapherotrites archaeon CG11_big_fil_rev_8_21_14_0_20_37_9]|nr:MAG: phosphoglycerate kinase [Candidatus Diapherotrites archaeon CG11_big_fil_rev_8_21_14_0_20_37_9]